MKSVKIDAAINSILDDNAEYDDYDEALSDRNKEVIKQWLNKDFTLDDIEACILYLQNLKSFIVEEKYYDDDEVKKRKKKYFTLLINTFSDVKDEYFAYQKEIRRENKLS